MQHACRRYLVREARALGLEVIDRCNLTVLQEPGQEDLPNFLAAHQARPPSCILQSAWLRMPPSSTCQPCVLVGAQPRCKILCAWLRR